MVGLPTPKMTAKTIQNSDDLLDWVLNQAVIKNDILNYLVAQSEVRKDWFGYTQQKMTAIATAHLIAQHHADKISPAQAVQYSIELNEQIFKRIIKQQ